MSYLRLQYILGTAKPYSQVSEIFIRDIANSDKYISYLNENFPAAFHAEMELKGNIDDYIKIIQKNINFPEPDISHIDIFNERLIDLSWIEDDHIVIVLLIHDIHENCDFFQLFDSLSRSVNILNLDINIEYKKKISILILI